MQIQIENEISTTNNVDKILQKIAKLQKEKNYRDLAKLGDFKVSEGHCGWGWSGSTDASGAFDLDTEVDAWEACCFESGLMNDVTEFQEVLPDELLDILGL